MGGLALNGLVNPFVPNAPFLCPVKTSKNRKVFSYFSGVEKGCIGNKWVNLHLEILILGKSYQDKLQDLRQRLGKSNAVAIIVQALDDVACKLLLFEYFGETTGENPGKH